MFIVHLRSRQYTKHLNCVHHLIVRKNLFLVTDEELGQKELSNLTEFAACPWSLAVDLDILTLGLQLILNLPIQCARGLEFVPVKRSDGLHWGVEDWRKDRCVGIRAGEIPRNWNGTGSGRHKHRTPSTAMKPLRSMLGLLSGVRWDVETILLHLKVNDYFSWLDNVNSSKRLKYGL